MRTGLHLYRSEELGRHGGSGRDWKEVIDEMADIMEYGKGKGIDMGGVMFGKESKNEQ